MSIRPSRSTWLGRNDYVGQDSAATRRGCTITGIGTMIRKADGSYRKTRSGSRVASTSINTRPIPLNGSIRWGWLVWEAARTWGCRAVHVPNAALTSRSFTGRSIASSHQRSRPSGLLNRKQRACIPGPRRTRVWEWFESMHIMDLCQTGSEDLSSLHRLNQPVSFRAAW